MIAASFPLLVALTSTVFGAPQAPEASPLADHIAACEAGRATLESLAAHLEPPRHRMQVTVEIQATTLRHGARPDDHGAREYRQDLRVFTVDAPGEDELAWRIDGERMNLARPDSPPRRTRINDHFAIVDPTGDLGPALTGSEALREQIVHRAAFPGTLCRFLRTAGRILDRQTTEDGGQQVLLELEGGRVLLRTLPIDYAMDDSNVRVPGLVGVDWITHSELLGDVVETLTYGDEPSPAPGVAGNWTVRGPFGSGEQSHVTAVVPDSDTAPFPGGYFPDPKSVGIDAASSAPVIEIRELGEGSFELLIADEASRILAVDLGPGWAILEAPVSSTVGRALILKLEEEKPGHPFLYVCASHHHPHYIGAMRPFVHRGATVVCPSGVADYVEHVVTRPRTLEPDELSHSRKEPEVIGIERGERWSPAEAPTRLIAMEADGHSAHTEAFMLFFLPGDKLAFGGDLLWINSEGERRGPNPRTRGLARILTDAEDLGTFEFLTSWPAGGAPMGTREWRDRAPVAEILATR